jgi:hypothetical protein
MPGVNVAAVAYIRSDYVTRAHVLVSVSIGGTPITKLKAESFHVQCLQSSVVPDDTTIDLVQEETGIPNQPPGVYDVIVRRSGEFAFDAVGADWTFVIHLDFWKGWWGHYQGWGIAGATTPPPT